MTGTTDTLMAAAANTSNTNVRCGRQRSQKPKMTKAERREKYTAIARKRREKVKERQFGGSRRHSRYGNHGKTRKDVCYLCRKPGHTVANCPKQQQGHAASAKSICYRCGSQEHTLSGCPQQADPNNRDNLAFATCYVCNQRGHLASKCPQNEHGLYVRGGSCRFCESVHHLSKHCPERPDGRNYSHNNTRQSKKQKEDDDSIIPDDEILQDLVENAESSRKGSSTPKAEVKKKRVVQF
uniref:CCHC-type domain-containing protein n=1 Tax=Craspedostauros australis TaxID=1486917 RepID=A0A7R9WTM5_9STRA|mmetsp:Transcript_17955/g.49807  ORF Transcript_17955/g.49807 Transcript_17955/m.49807 type:complete len:239 (+) Transcript_17955:337-1053(+)|eukprot:CAMPEP_0198124770 /NCGR_PEP_ID=MMETSP1442-20131203/40848_1 /TAXON_ID= /ORGANISM="Craspedostauros australis, Strain CCMP3328" /LENGTH=238 /DNA_ID=CAMNT_0043784243 /DNA_START=165 /DNA_END=881 /DNA_ORIENTATION=+